MSAILSNQARTFLALIAELKPYLRSDRNLPARIQQRLARERRFGSRDRRLYRELLYTAIRYLPWFEACEKQSEDAALRATLWLAADIPALAQLKAHFLADWPSLPDSLSARAQHLGVSDLALPVWMQTHCPEAFLSPNYEALNAKASLWLRLQTDQTAPVFAEFEQRQWTWRTSPLLPDAIELLTEADVTTTDAYQRGLFEIQDLGSQLVLNMIAPTPGTHWLDACAGAGGKTLQLARLLGPDGRVDATEPRASALSELQQRAHRSGLHNITAVRTPKPPRAHYDGVLVDAPCSGSGTWRRSPHLKWCTQPSDLEAAATLQKTILAEQSTYVGPGGLLVYVTCSLSHVENASVIADFLGQHPEFSPAPIPQNFGFTADDAPHQRLLLPARHNTDGFFVACLRRS